MNILTLILQAPAGQQPVGGGWSMWVMLILIFVIMWFFMIRPQRKQQKESEKFRNALKKGDKVVTGKYAGQELKLDGEDYVIVKMADILAVVE